MATIDALRDMVWEKHNGVCDICSEPVSRVEMQMDHIVPRAIGGADSLDNLRPAHRVCNQRRLEGRRRGATHPAWKGGLSAKQIPLSPDLRVSLQDSADRNQRSLNAEILYRLRESILADRGEHPKP